MLVQKERAKSCDLMKEDILRGQCWPGSICPAICLMFNYSMFSSLIMPPPSMKRFWHVEIHTTLPCPTPRASLVAATQLTSHLFFVFINIHLRVLFQEGVSFIYHLLIPSYS
ncbi:hypothetical protein ILYODFUR_004068 [Ilyodon furcidens]|uniref:Uncharacterized protein n=1 Tax=Ilyodon furcidens TaxID=33524 RepID=A0ABV0V189_9TELE